VERVTAKNIKPIVQEMVSEDAHLMTDTSGVGKSVAGKRKRSQVNHTENEYVRLENGEKITTNTVESFFSILKRGNIGVYHHWSRKYMELYLWEFDWRYNVRKIADIGRTFLALKNVGTKRLLLKTQE
jgi:hypothetical protein